MNGPPVYLMGGPLSFQLPSGQAASVALGLRPPF